MTTNEITLRASVPGDAAALAEINNAIYPDNPLTGEAVAARDRDRERAGPSGRWVAVLDGQVVGQGMFFQSGYEYAPGRFRVWVGVRPEARRRGIGAALFDRALAGLAPHAPQVLRAQVRADQRAGLAFLARHGFQEVMRQQESVLDVAAFDPAPYAGLDERLAAEGITIRTLAELESDAERDRKLYDLEWALFQDTPGVDTSTRRPFDEWVANEINNPRLPHDGYFIALDGSRYIGLTHFWDRSAAQGPTAFAIGLTAVLPDYRRRGIATALKVRSIRYAQAVGCPTIRTASEEHNAPMLTLNTRLGFIRLPAWITADRTVG